jgi:phytanoyl-CoA hydroxylase
LSKKAETLKNEISDSQVEAFQQNGFVLIDGFLTEAELNHWRDVTDEAVADRLQKKDGAESKFPSDSYYAQVFTQCIKLAETHAGMKNIMFDDRLGRIAATLAEVDGIRIWHDQALIKPPFGNPTAWHLDNPYWSFSSKQSISIWVALDDATLLFAGNP